MKTRLCLASVATLILTACPEVHVPMNFGTAPARLEAGDWNGSWSNPASPDETMRFTVDPKHRGIIVAEEEGGKKGDDEKLTFHLRQVSSDSEHDDLYFMLTESDDSLMTGTPYLLREGDDGVVFFWVIDHDAVEAGINSGALRGKVVKPDEKGTHCTIEAVESNYAELIKPQYWNWLEPTCIHRSTKAED